MAVAIWDYNNLLDLKSVELLPISFTIEKKYDTSLVCMTKNSELCVLLITHMQDLSYNTNQNYERTRTYFTYYTCISSSV